MATVVFTGLDWTGTPDEEDIRGAVHYIKTVNAIRAADLDENGDPILPPLPFGTNPEKKASYIEAVLSLVQTTHNSMIQQEQKAWLQSVKPLAVDATDSERDAAVTALGG